MEKKNAIKKDGQTKKLGRGIGALLPEEDLSTINDFALEKISQDSSRTIKEIPLQKLSPNKFQPRAYFDEEKIQELAESIKTFGILEPLLVSREDNGLFHIIAGERRYRAAKIAGLKSVPSVVLSVTDEEKLEIAIIENLQREDLNPIEIAISFKEVLALNKLTQDALAKKLGISRPVVSNYIRLLSLPQEIQEALQENRISQSHGRLLLSIEDKEEQLKKFYQITKQDMSVDLLDKEIKKNSTKTSKKKKDNISNIYEQKLIEFFGTKVNINGNIEKGHINIQYFNKEDFSRIIEVLNISLD